MRIAQKERGCSELEKQKPESERKQREKGRFRKWLRANRLPLLEVALIATVAGAFFYKYPPPGDRFVQLYEKGMIEFKELPLDDKFTVWRNRLLSKKCFGNYEDIMTEAFDEYELQSRLGNEQNAKQVFSEIEFYIRNMLEVKADPKCKKDLK